MTRCALLLAGLIAIGCEQPVTRADRVAPKPPTAAPGFAPGPPAPKPASAADDLRVLGQRTLDDLARRLPELDVQGPGSRAEIVALGPCVRPAPDERKAVARAIAAADHDAKGADLTFGCKDPTGIVVNVAYDRIRGRDERTGVWRVVRASSTAETARVTTLAQYTGTSTQDYMEWAIEMNVRAAVLVDLDGDGNHDAIIVRSGHEGGGSHFEVVLATWTSRAGRTASPATFEHVVDVSVARGQPHGAGAPLVIRIDHEYAEPRAPEYRCIEPTGALDLCAAIDETRRVDRIAQIADWFVTGHRYGPYQTAQPDRDELAGLLAELGVAPAERTALLAEVEPAKPEVRVAREIAPLLAAPGSRRFGELEDKPLPPDPRAAELRALLGDAPCTPATPAQAKASVSRIASWVAANDARALIDHGDCTAGAPCRWSHPTKPVIDTSCVAAQRGYYSVRWSYLDKTKGELLAHDALVFLDAGAATLVSDGIAIGASEACGPCGTSPPLPQLSLKMYRHGTALVAVLLGYGDPSQPPSLAFAVDGTLTKLPPLTGSASWYRFGESRNTAGRDADDLIEIRSTKPDVVGYWHWDAGWKQVAAFPWLAPRALQPALDPTGAWLWQQQQRGVARDFLGSFEVTEWAGKPDYRADTRQSLILLGADPARLARVAAAERDVHPAP